MSAVQARAGLRAPRLDAAIAHRRAIAKIYDRAPFRVGTRRRTSRRTSTHYLKYLIFAREDTARAPPPQVADWFRPPIHPVRYGWRSVYGGRTPWPKS
jgi:hypothetical protein